MGRGRSSVCMASVLGVVVGLLGGCFNGSDALGLPCNDDNDCGRNQSCEAGLCGGAPASGSDSGSDSSGTAHGSTTAATGDDTPGTESSTGVVLACGNGIMEEGEVCDPGPEATADCDADCTAVECGDAVINMAAGESCDPPGSVTCTEACDAVLFFDDMSDAAKSENEFWRTGLPLIQGLQLLPEAQWRVLGTTWRSGAYSCRAGVAELVTAPFPLDEVPAGQHIELSFRHRFTFDPNASPTCVGILPADGGIVELIADGQPSKVNGIYGAASVLVAGECAKSEDNPLPVGPAYTRSPARQGFATVSASLEIPPAAGAALGEVRFSLGYDCNNCGHMCDEGKPMTAPPPEYGWEIDDVRIEYVPN